MSQLTLLELKGCSLQPCACAPDATCCFLQVLDGMQQLQDLTLRDLRLTMGAPSSSAFANVDPAYLSALTASAHLASLEVSCDTGTPLPRTVVQHMFPAGKQLQHLRELALFSDDDLEDSRPFIATAELKGLACACPALSRLCLAHAVEPGDMSGFLQLPASCQGLSVSGAAFNDQAAATICQLTQLTSLGWTFSPDLTEAGLDQLTALKQLQELSLFDNLGLCHIIAPEWRDHPGFEDDPFLCGTWAFSSEGSKVCNAPCCIHWWRAVVQVECASWALAG